MLLRKTLSQVTRHIFATERGLVLVELSFIFEEKVFGLGQTLFQVISDPQGAGSIFIYLNT